MSYSVALAGKGGTGKTTLAGLFVKYLVEKKMTPVLAVDADSNANLNEVLGLTVDATLGDAREQMKKEVSPGMTKDIFMQMKLQEAVVEAEGFDLIVMGRPEGPGCYCAANTLLTQALDALIDNYPYVVMDNEAGMEHVSRLTTNNIEILLVVSDPTRRGIQAASRIVKLAESLGLRIGQKKLVVNQARKGQMDVLAGVVAEYGLDLLGIVPEDEELQEYDLNGKPTVALPPDNGALIAAYEIFDKMLQG